MYKLTSPAKYLCNNSNNSDKILWYSLLLYETASFCSSSNNGINSDVVLILNGRDSDENFIHLDPQYRFICFSFSDNFPLMIYCS